MRSNTFMAGVVAVVLTVVLVITPFGVPTVITAAKAAKAETNKLENYNRNEQTLHNMVVSAQNSFADSREFDVYFGDTAGVYSVLKNIAGIEIKSMTQVDPMDNYADRGAVVEGSNPAAVRLDMVVSDVKTALQVVQKMQLPMVDVSYNAPNSLSVTFLTGGALK